MTFLYVLHVFALMTQSYTGSRVVDDIRSTSFLSYSIWMYHPPDEL